MFFTIHKVSEHGIEHPVVARLAVQTFDLIEFAGLNKQQRNEVAKLYVDTLQSRLLKCHEIFDKLCLRLNESVSQVGEQTDPQLRQIPHVVGLQVEVEGFLYEVKNYLRDFLGFFRICFGCSLKNASDLYDPKGNGDSNLVTWAATYFGADHSLTRLLRTEQPWVEQLIRMRNAVEHPGGHSGTLTIFNVRALKDGRLIPPSWSRGPEHESDILSDMATTLDNMLTLAEDVLVECAMHTTPFPAIAFYEIPETDRDKKCPKRLKVGLKPEITAAIAQEAESKRANGGSEQCDDKN
jgi:hypothetical protein